VSLSDSRIELYSDTAARRSRGNIGFIKSGIPLKSMSLKSRKRYARPTFPNAGVDAWYRTQLQALVNEMSQSLLDTVRRAWRDAGLAQDARKRPTPAILLDRSLEKWGGLWVYRTNKAALKIATAFAKRNRKATETSMMAALADAGFTVRFRADKLTRNAVDAVIAENVGLIKSIPQRYLSDVQVEIMQNVMNGSDLGALTDSLVEKYGIAHRRAAFIAKDQNHKAKAAIERARRLDVGITHAKWKHSHAGRDPRPTHVAMDGELYDIAVGMFDEAVNHNVWPGTEPHCRCTDEPEIPGFT
jgi:uncharacterized protein with gpF-like domain